MTYKEAEQWANQNKLKTLGIAAALFIVVVMTASAIIGPEQTSNATAQNPAPATKAAASPAPKPTYEATILNSTPISPAELNVVVQTKNTSSTASKPSCTVRAASPSGSYSGWDIVDVDKEIEAGGIYTWRVVLTITNEGASYATDTSVTCK